MGAEKQTWKGSAARVFGRRTALPDRYGARAPHDGDPLSLQRLRWPWSAAVSSAPCHPVIPTPSVFLLTGIQGQPCRSSHDGCVRQPCRSCGVLLGGHRQHTHSQHLAGSMLLLSHLLLAKAYVNPLHRSSYPDHHPHHPHHLHHHLRTHQHQHRLSVSVQGVGWLFTHMPAAGRRRDPPAAPFAAAVDGAAHPSQRLSFDVPSGRAPRAVTSSLSVFPPLKRSCYRLPGSPWSYSHSGGGM